MLRNRGIAFKLIIFFLLSSGLIFLIVFAYHYRFSRRTIEKNVEDNARNIVLSTINRIEAVIRPVQKVPEHLAYFIEHGSCDQQELLLLIRKVVENSPEVYGSTMAFEPYAFNGKPALAPYFYKSGGKMEFADLAAGSYRYFYWDWYQIPKELERPDWSEPYFDEGGGNILMATYSVPFYRYLGGRRRFAGVVTSDVSLEWLQEVVSSIKVLQTGYGFLISKNGMLVTHPEKHLIMNATLFGLAEIYQDEELKRIGKKMIRGESGSAFLKSAVFRKECRIYFAPIPSCGWSLAVVFPEDERMADVAGLNRTAAFLGIAGIVLLGIAVVFIARSITRPLREMAKAAGVIATGNLDVELPPRKSGDEAGRLMEAFGSMKNSLKDHIRQLTETTASKERIESELKIAHDIQLSILPKIFPPFPGRKDIDVYARIEPAKEVGGDFYDFFFLDDQNLCLVIGDVSGKGVPAALFMAVAKTLLKATGLKGIDPGRILTEVNRELSQGNDSCMFATIFYGILNTATGVVSYANGGHNSPLIVRSGGEVSFVEGKRGLVVGAMEDSVYETESFTLLPGDGLFMYTDGVTEAVNEAGDLFSEARLKARVNVLHGRSIRELISGVMEEVVSFSTGVPQSDDITMMMLSRRL